jgi:hypothetical protein
MPGVRVQHPTARLVRYTVIDGSIPYPEPFVCSPPALGGCGGTHLFKAHHLNLDDVGACIVSVGVFERIKGRLIADGFTLATEIKDPPPLAVGRADPVRAVPILASPSNRTA